MARWRIRRTTKPLRGVVRVPGDKSIAHRLLLLCPLATGISRVRGLPDGDDVRATREAVQALGAAVREGDGGWLSIEGAGLRSLRAPTGLVDCARSGTTMRLLAGVLCWQHFDVTLGADAQLARRPMARITRPLRARGARIDGVFDAVRNDEHAPLSIRGVPRGARLSGCELRLEIASAQVKSAILLSGLDASGPTILDEPVVTRDHTERLLDAMRAPLETAATTVSIDPTRWNGRLEPIDVTLPNDPSSAAFLLVAAHLVLGSRIAVKDVCTNPTRIGFVEVLRDMGGAVWCEGHGDAGGEPIGDLHVGASGLAALRGPARVGGELAVRVIDEIPALVAAAASVPVVSEFRDLRELRVKESDRIAALAEMLDAYGIAHEVLDDGIRLEGVEQPRARRPIHAHGDHRIAMAAAVLALRAEGETLVDGVECVEKSFPAFARVLHRLGAQIEVGL